MAVKPSPVQEIKKARVLAVLGDSVTTDHISPAGSIKKDSPAGKYLQENGVKPADFNSYGSRRGNHEVMVRGTFANVRLRNKLAPETEGGMTKYLPSGEVMTIFDASVKYIAAGVPLIVLAGKEYGSGSSRDWAAKGPLLLGVRAVIAESYERIHRSNLVGMGILPLQFLFLSVYCFWQYRTRRPGHIRYLCHSRKRRNKAKRGKCAFFRGKERPPTPACERVSQRVL